jgi:hypothetical protein
MAGTEKDAILYELLAEAEKRFGPGRIEALRPTLEATAGELALVRAAVAGPEVEPMFYPQATD